MYNQIIQRNRGTNNNGYRIGNRITEIPHRKSPSGKTRGPLRHLTAYIRTKINMDSHMYTSITYIITFISRTE